MNEISEFFESNPEGGSLKEIAEATEGSMQNTHYHLVRMKRKGEIVKIKSQHRNEDQRRGQRPYIWKKP
jgi:predicted transcriptional regulator